MCRLFGFRSVLQGRVHRSLMAADNALAVQSSCHPDGWGVAYYVEGTPHVVRSADTALSDPMFHRVSGVVSSQTVLAHVRKATQGERHTLNCHPFQHGRWVLAHNGDVPRFSEVRAELVARVAPQLRGFLLGDTDSEVVFLLFLTKLAELANPQQRGLPIQVVEAALRAAVDAVREVADRRPGVPPALLTLVVTDGEILVAHQGGKELHWSTWKARCAEREGCPAFGPTCEAPSTGQVNHLLVSSEPLLGENHWMAVAPGRVVGVDAAMRLHAPD